MISPFRIMLTVALSGTVALCQSQPIRLVHAGKSDIRLDQQFANKPVPKWENGYFVSIDTQSAHVPDVTVFSASGGKLFKVPLAIDGSARILPSALAVSAKGTVAIAGTAFNVEGVGANFIALIDGSGRLTRVVRLDGFAALQLCFTIDDRLWAAGRAIIYPRLDAPPDHHIIRIYNQSGTLERSALLRSSFPAGKLHPAGRAHLSANDDSVVMFSAEAERLVGFSNSGDVIFSMQARLPDPEALVTGFAISDTNELVMSCQIPDPAQTGKDVTAFYRWSNSDSAWVQIYSRRIRDIGGYHAVYGFDGDNLLVSVRLPQFAWVRIER